MPTIELKAQNGYKDIMQAPKECYTKTKGKVDLHNYFLGQVQYLANAFCQPVEFKYFNLNTVYTVYPNF